MHKCLTSSTRLRGHTGSFPESTVQPERSGRGRDEGWVKAEWTATRVGSMACPPQLCAHLAQRRGSKVMGAPVTEWQPQGLSGEPIRVPCDGAKPGDVPLPLGWTCPREAGSLARPGNQTEGPGLPVDLSKLTSPGGKEGKHLWGRCRERRRQLGEAGDPTTPSPPRPLPLH